MSPCACEISASSELKPWIPLLEWKPMDWTQPSMLGSGREEKRGVCVARKQEKVRRLWCSGLCSINLLETTQTLLPQTQLFMQFSCSLFFLLFSTCSLLPVVLPSSVSLSLVSFWDVAPSVCVKSHCKSNF